ncbi:SDR family oxidoreductase [Amaricoccus solimangrovi]|uniref:SDR family oxidoreductase n=2 Tax=Amaricoccus solimangrovi TaxID=2589815 RepID=A0A501WI72_9RHOB|nr:SDR family oxidoreductase [Amaricoccus solimangrovi]
MRWRASRSAASCRSASSPGRPNVPAPDIEPVNGPSKMKRLEGKKALVIGSATGIGAAVCRLFGQEGADVALADLGRTEPREALVAELTGLGVDAFALECDVTDRAQVEAAVAAAVARFGAVDIVVNNAGLGANADFPDQDWEQWHRVIDINLNGVAYGMKAALAHMLPRGKGRIINTASQLSHKPAPGNAVYCAAKAGVVGLSVSVAQEVAARGVTINCVCPGPTDTPMWNAGDDDWNKWKLSTLPIRRIGQPEEIAWAYVYLASDEAGYMVGQSISPNGGDVMW